MNKISVVILNWNGCEMLRSFLPSVLRYSEAEGVEVCVADNGSTDQSVEMLRREFPSVRRILLDGNHGFADWYNLALRQVEAEYVVLLNSDVEVTGQWLQPMAAYLDAHPEVAACQPKITQLATKRMVRICRSCRRIHRPLRISVLSGKGDGSSRSGPGAI